MSDFSENSNQTQLIGLRIREARKSLNMRQADLSNVTEISVSHLSHIERGDMIPTIPTLRRISQALDRPVEYFLREPQAPHALGMVMTRTLLGKTAVTEFARRVSEKTDGELTIQIYQHAWAYEQVQGLADGSIHVFLDDLLSFETFSALCGIVGLPYFFHNRDHYQRFLQSKLFQDAIFQKLLDNGIRLLNPISNWEYGTYELLFATDPIFTPDDLAGRKFRSFSSPAAQALRLALGANPVQIPWSLGYEAFQQGEIDTFLAPIGSAPPLKLHEVAQYVTLINYGYTLNLMVAINENVYRHLSPRAQQALYETLEETGERFSQAVQEPIAHYLTQLSTDYHLPIIQPAPEIWRDRFDQAIQHICLEQKLLDQATFDQLKNL
ncbi:MAG: TRAP transporter substrate-binding protein DctP [Anaerolineales bacterium]|nr:TRAP transporter substrate-binding protein DctP [Anaerolineales bacterium]